MSLSLSKVVSSFLTDEELLIEGPFMKILQGRKNTGTELTIKPERASSDKNGDSSSSLMREQQLDSNDKSDVMHAPNYILPYFLEENLENLELMLLPFTKLPFSNVQDGDMSLSHLINNRGNLSPKPEFSR